ncbi:MAG: hypothetical protein JWM39_204 [Parcubacteria group bacterium]|nr:hypothetical protein [Parcubacteria group bacterium]
MRHEDPLALAHLRAERHVQRGIRWLYQNAPPGWLRNCFNPLPEGRSYFRANNSYDNECVLALAFEFVAKFRSIDGAVTFATVSNAFGMHGRVLDIKGFNNYCYHRRNLGCQIDSKMLNDIWNDTLRDPKRRHPLFSKSNTRRQAA